MTQAIAHFIENAIGDGIFLGNDGCRFQPGHDVCFPFGIIRGPMSTGLGDDDIWQQAAVHRFSDGNDMMCPLAGNRIFFKGCAVGLPLEDEGFHDIVKQLAGQGDVRVDVITEDVFIRMDDLNFVFMLVLPFGVLFNLPLVLIVLAKLDFITSAMLAKKRKYIILLAFIATAVITPTTDILSQCLLALPMIALLEISRLIIRYGLHR